MDIVGEQNKHMHRDMTGRRVRHLIGQDEGTVVKQVFNFMTVLFDNSKEKRTFSYPSSIGRYLEFLDDEPDERQNDDNCDSGNAEYTDTLNETGASKGAYSLKQLFTDKILVVEIPDCIENAEKAKIKDSLLCRQQLTTNLCAITSRR